ncbi:ankyrin [Trematosphaeria pertusa]|uniref:Ankyrin n=1 Tax=Trematosphaeria pertusa TaxID=390896 RepID=A0A6A6J296_9PLEO|nr:ankyrin [Trematosphaeria pertusa]KAF2256521.1 ankyrin [Trematosphaeria pertusa]
MRLAITYRRLESFKFVVRCDLRDSVTQDARAKALEFAAYENCCEMMEIVIKEGSVDIEGTYYTHPLTAAVKNGSLEAVQLLIRSGAQVNVQDKKWTSKNPYPGSKTHSTLVHTAAGEGRDGILKELVSAGARLREADSNYDAIRIGMKSKNLKLITCLLRVGAVLRVRDSEPQDLLKLALFEGSEELAELALASGAHAGPDIVRMALKLRYFGIIDVLLKVGAIAKAGNGGLESVLGIAVDENWLWIARTALKAGADPEAKEDRYFGMYVTVFNRACALGREDLVRVFIEYGVNVNGSRRSKSASGSGTPIFYAAGCGHDSVVKLLRQHGAVVYGKLPRKDWMVSKYVKGKKIRALTALLRSNPHININEPDGYGYSPLFNAMRGYLGLLGGFGTYGEADDHYLDIVEFLLSRGARLNATDRDWRHLLGKNVEDAIPELRSHFVRPEKLPAIEESRLNPLVSVLRSKQGWWL